MSDSPDAVIVGAGLAGLCCGKRLAECGVTFRILEAADGVGGRVRTDLVDGFRLDRGFQVYLTAYPEGRRVLDLAALDLQPFTRGALVWFGGKFHRVADPRAEPFAAVKSLANPIGTARDKLRLARLHWDAAKDDWSKPDARARESNPERLTLDVLRERFSPAIVDRFFRPFLGGVFLEKNLTTSSRFFRFVFHMFADGPGAVPALGMQAIPDQIAATLPAGSVQLGVTVDHVGDREVIANGEAIRTRAVVVATEGLAAHRLLGEAVPDPGSNGTMTLYYSAPRAPVVEPILVLDGEGQGPVNNLVVMPNSPAGKSLVAVSVVGVPADDDAELDRKARVQLAEWFGADVMAWRFLRAYRIPHALPDQTAGKLDPWRRAVRVRPGLYVCGDHRDNASIDGAMTSGFRAAQAAMEDLSAKRA